MRRLGASPRRAQILSFGLLPRSARLGQDDVATTTGGVAAEMATIAADIRTDILTRDADKASVP
jgi:hypothetical protein